MELSKKEKKRADEVSKQIDAEIKKDKAQRDKKDKYNRILLLGSGDSGKSTVLKQMRVLQNQSEQQDFTIEEKKLFKQHMIENIVDSIIQLVKAANILEYHVDPINMEFYNSILEEPQSLMQVSTSEQDVVGVIPKNLANSIYNLWKDNAIQRVYEQSNRFNIQDTCNYFLDNIIEFSVNPDFLPGNEEILRIRVPTTKISETIFTKKKKDKDWIVIDVGGQRSQRLFWTPYFNSDNLNAIIYVASLSAYDQTLLEDPDTNRMDDSLTLFQNISMTESILSVPIILFLNKIDIMESKIKTSSVRYYCPDFDHVLGRMNVNDKDVKPVQAYFRKKYLSMLPDTKRPVYTHFTTSTDTTIMKVVMAAVSDIVLRLSLSQYGVHGL